MSGRRVVVTGLGIVSPVGLDLKESWDNIVAGTSGVVPITEYDASGFPVRFAATVKNFDASRVIPVKDQRKMDVFIHYGLVAAEEALQDSGLEITDENADRIGVSIGSGIGGLPMIETCHLKMIEGGPRKVSPFFVPGSIINMISGNFSIKHGIKGPNIALVTACSTGTHSIGQAARMIAYGDADVMIAGGSEKASSPLGINGFAAARALSTRNDDPAHSVPGRHIQCQGRFPLRFWHRLYSATDNLCTIGAEVEPESEKPRYKCIQAQSHQWQNVIDPV